MYSRGHLENRRYYYRYPKEKETLHQRCGYTTILDPRQRHLGTLIKDKFASIRDDYGKPKRYSMALCLKDVSDPSPEERLMSDPTPVEIPKHTIVLAHGLMGFDEIHLGGPFLPAIQYWQGIRQILASKGVNVVTATVSPFGSIEERAAELARMISERAKGQDINIIAYANHVRLFFTESKLFSLS